MDEKTLIGFGEASNQLLAQGMTAECREMCDKIISVMEEAKVIDSYLSAKVSLNYMLSLILEGKAEEAFEIWIYDENETSTGDFNFDCLGVGGNMILQGQTTPHDLMLYYMISAFFHSIADTTQDNLDAIQEYIERALEFGEENNADYLPFFLNHWMTCLENFFMGGKQIPIPKDFVDQVTSTAEGLGLENFQFTKKLQFLTPDKWELPPVAEPEEDIN